MAGGIFPGQPFTLNIKCIIFALLCMGLFLIKPEEVPIRKEFSLFILFVVAYVAMAWYDYYYNCQLMPFERGTSSVTAELKPEEQESLCGLEKHRYHMMIYAAHIFFIVPLLAYFYYKKGKVSDRMYGMLGALVVFTFLYHAYKMLYSGKSENESESESEIEKSESESY